MAPLKPVQFRKNYRNWVQDSTKILMAARNAARDIASMSKKDEDWTTYKNLRNRCNKLVRQDRINQQANLFNMYDKEKNSKNSFKLTKEILGWSSGKTPSSFKIDGRTVCSPQDVANVQLDYYTQKTSQLIRDLPVNAGDPLSTLKTTMNKWRHKDDLPKFKLSQVNATEVLKIIKSLGNNTAYGHDRIDAMAIKDAAMILYQPLTHLVNLSMSTSKFANSWKIARVIPLFKGKGLDPQSPKSYRPISLLPTVSKIVEKVVQAQMLKHMESRKLLNRNSHAYRSLHSTTSAMMQLSDTINEYTDRNMITAAMTIDETSAFDCVDYSVLKRKLELYNFHNETISWVDSYLSYRSHFISIGTKDSRITSIHQGVPQGSVLGPLFFSIYTNELSQVINSDECTNDAHQEDEYLFGNNCPDCGSIPTYADDATYVVANHTREQNQTQIESNMVKITNFLNCNKLTVNQPKTVIIEIMSKQKRNWVRGTPPQLSVRNPDGSNKIIHAKKNIRLLGGNLQDNLSWQAHLETGEKPLLPELRKKLGALRHLGPGVPRATRLKLSNAIIISRLLYLVPIWGGAPSTYLNKVQRFLNKSARYVNNQGRRSPTRGLMSSCNWLNVRQLAALQSLSLMWNIIWMQSPLHLSRKIAVDDDMLLSTNNARLQSTQASYRWRTISTWNQLPVDIRHLQSLPKFKSAVKKWMKETKHLDPDHLD